MYVPKCNRNIEGGLSSKWYKKAARRFQLVSSILFESSCFIGSYEKNNEKEFYDLLVWPSILCLI